jgi:di/tricarboxylate transporter
VLPLLMAVSLESRTSPSGILMPVGYATIIGGMATTIGTSTNLLVTSLAADFGVPPFGLFDFAAPVLLVGSIAILYLWLIAPRLLPDRRPPLSDTAPRLFQARLLIEDDSPVAGGTLAEALARTNQQMKVARITRGELSLVRLPLVLLKPGDCLHVRDTPERLKEFERHLGATLIGSDTEQRVDSAHPLRSAQCLAEVVVTPGSRLDHETLNSTKLLYAYGVQPLALHQPGKSRTEGAGNLANERLLPGDVLLLQGEPKAFERLKRSSEVLLLDGRIDLPRTARAPIAALVMIGVVTLGATGLMRLSIAAVAGVGLLLATRCLTARQALEALDRRIILVIVASLAVGNALMLTGGAEYIAALYVAATQQLAPAFVLAGLMLIMAMLTEVATNNAIALIGTPIAISVARQLGVPAEPFVLAVLYGANMSYLTPTGYQTNLLVMSAGGYRFSDFVRAGLPLQIIMWLGLALVLPIIYDL